MEIRGIHHVSVIVHDLAVACAFYESVLGLRRRDDRPGDPSEGAWYQAGSQQIHLIVAGRRTPERERSGGYPGRSAHVALRVDDLQALGHRLEAEGIPTVSSRSGRPVLFCRDPDGNVLELIGS